MKRAITLAALLFLSKFVFSQSVAASNFNYWYDPTSEVELQIRPVRTADKIMVRYTLLARHGNQNKYSIAWEARNSYVEQDAIPIREKDSVLHVTENSRRGFLILDVPEKPWLLLGHVSNGSKAWTYYKVIDSKYPIDGWIETAEGVITENHLSKNKEYIARSADNKPLIVSYYSTPFPPALPPFAESEGGTERFLFQDSVFSIASGATFLPKKEGLYLFQEDTSLARGFSYRVVRENFPKFTKIDELIAPLRFVTDDNEYNELVSSQGEKAKFDKVILNMTGDKDRAKTFMRDYFKRIELANIYFSSYKEGWKTDRGMIYVIFGPPRDVSRNNGNEIWDYKDYNVKFTFVRKNGSVYDPETYILLRDRNFNDTWLNMIDLWRKGRF